MANKTALVTGASAGLGKVFAERLAKQGYDLFLVARRLDRLQGLAKELSDKYKVKVTPIAADLAKMEDRDAMFKATGGENSEIDLLINNAGLGYMKACTELTRKEMLTMIDINITAVADISHMYLPTMIKRKKGDMIIISSLSAFQPVPFFSVYASTKGFDLLFSEALHYEVKKQGVHVLTVCPGFTKTEFAEATGVKEKNFFENAMSAETVIDMSLTALKKRKRLIITGGKNNFSVFVQRFFPRAVNNWFISRMFLAARAHSNH